MNVRSVDYLSEEKNQQKKTGNALVVDTSTQGLNDVTFKVTSEPEKPAFDLAELEKKIPKAFRGYLKPVMDWADSVEARLNAIQQEMPAQIQGAMEAAIENARQKQIAAMQQARQNMPQGGGGGFGGGLFDGITLKDILGGGGGGMDGEYMQLAKDALKSQIGMSTAITNAVVSKIVGKAATDVASAVSGE